MTAETLGVAANKILVRVKRLGGGFGGKETRSIMLSTAVALAAFKYVYNADFQFVFLIYTLIRISLLYW